MARDLLKGPLQKPSGVEKSSPSRDHEKNRASTDFFININVNINIGGNKGKKIEQKAPLVTVFDSSMVPEPFLDSVLWEAIINGKRRRKSWTLKTE